MSLKVGDKLPDLELDEGTPQNKVNLRKLAAGKKIVIVTTNGAFTPCCSKTHVPSYVSNYEKFKQKGIDEIVVVAVNDAYVMEAWSESLNAKGKLRFLADTHGQLCKATGLVLDLVQDLGTIKCKRACMYVEDGVVKCVNMEPDGKGTTCTNAENILDKCGA